MKSLTSTQTMYLNEFDYIPVDLDDFFYRLPSKPSIKKLLNNFVRAYPDLLSDVQQSIHSGEGEKIKSSAHMLKGVLGNLSLNKASELALELENNAGNIEKDDALALVDEIKSELIILDEFLKSNPPVFE